MKAELTTPKEPQKGGGLLAVISLVVAAYLIYLASTLLF